MSHQGARRLYIKLASVNSISIPVSFRRAFFLTSTPRLSSTRTVSFSTFKPHLKPIQTPNYNNPNKNNIMALPPKFAGARLVFPQGASSPSEPLHTVEVFLDYACPFSAKMFKTLHTTVFPSLSTHPSPVQFIFRHQLQPWHPSSTLLHEASLAILRLAPHKFYDFSAALFAEQTSYFDVNVVNETRNDTYRRLARLAARSVGVDEEEVYGLLVVSDKPGQDGSLNSGNQVTGDVKLVVKIARLVGVHVSPTVIFDGVVVGEISSSWTGEQWGEWLGKNAV